MASGSARRTVFQIERFLRTQQLRAAPWTGRTSNRVSALRFIERGLASNRASVRPTFTSFSRGSGMVPIETRGHAPV